MDHGAVVLPRSIRAERAGDSLSGRGRCGDRFRSRIERLRPFRPGNRPRRAHRPATVRRPGCGLELLFRPGRYAGR